MRAVRGSGLLIAAAVWIASACSGALRFDENTADGSTGDGSAADAAPEAPLGDATTGADAEADVGGPDAICADPTKCGWQRAECGSNSDDGCELHCPSGSGCTNSTCGAGCVAECFLNSSCSITAGDAAHIECQTGASCTVRLGVGGNATCSNGSSCRLQCLGACSLTCRTGATCQLQCGDADSRTVTGSASCP